MPAPCLVTGASRGIGLQIAKTLASNGHSILLSSQNKDALMSAKSQLPLIHPSQQHTMLPLDFNNIPQIIEDTAKLPPISHFINCAGISSPQLLMHQKYDQISRVININLHAPLIIAKHLSKNMLKSSQTNHMIFISTSLTAKGVSGAQIYTASKSGIEGFARSLAAELSRKRVLVNCISPGLVNTDMGQGGLGLLKSQIIPEFVDCDEISKTVLFLINSKSITGQVIRVDNGFSV